jgi:hypothetical protein|tara:strand:- start:1097 stop:1390 length:294 start_codon:yes stop_codon:yes gene_type:complete
MKMRKLLLTISFLTLLSSALMAKTETTTEEICKSPAGCSINMKTGECPDCISITKTIVTTKRRWNLSKKTLEVPKSYYNYGYPTLAGINLLTSTFHK